MIFKYYLQRLLWIDLLKSLWLTAKHIFSSKITIEYPEQFTPVSARARGLHALRRTPDGDELCIACKLCQAACPALAINVEPYLTKEGTYKAEKYEIDLFKCVYCGLCEEACPVNAIVQTNLNEYCFTQPGSQILTKEKLLAIGDHYAMQLTENKQHDQAYR